jgi:hypothetical protein
VQHSLSGTLEDRNCASPSAGGEVVHTGSGINLFLLGLLDGSRGRLISSRNRRDGHANASFITVPGILAEGTYTEAAKGAQYIIYCASPITSGITAVTSNSSSRLPQEDNIRPR